MDLRLSFRETNPCDGEAKMANKTILVTGSTGWLGGKLCEALVARGVNVVGLARRKTEIDGLMGCVMADLSTGKGLEFLSALRIDCCVHLAAVAGWGELADCLATDELRKCDTKAGPRAAHD